ncbi:MAG: glucosamine-6-phosphate deaminase [Clostridia bacterium]|nr:glucosamine-6-phosphate deaminase [Clostridia bacterium]MBQ3651908.1 glucosamine-6-phosphate deaminase [Clostridia bacterium]MBQ6865919.1 glucosamine-6-phosphate deaminase [Clostridia bacterium]MBQ7754942.1 glucosamine-6-phosphate deaminase [Clostridia bacterium]MBR0422329.1 glucosamine-6-phosphate deaminase [Clostridia bacterium]
MKIIIDSAEKIAALAAQQYVDLLKRKPNAILGGATGSTPLGLYAELVRLNKAREISFKDASSFNLDEYVGLDGTHDQSYRYFMDHNLFDHIDIDKSRTRVPSGIDVSDPSAYDKEIAAAGGVDLQLLGIGNNGHIGFNEPGTPFGSLTHVVELTESTREANKRFFKSIDEVPTHAVTMGVKTVMQARSIILMAIGPAKAPIMKEMLQGPVTEKVPASVLQLHPDVTVYMDFEAAKLL